MLCHGSGDLTRDGCCYVAGSVCPLRWKIVNGHVYDAAGADLGTVESFVASYTKAKPRQQAILEQLAGVTYVCKAAADVISNDPSVINDRARLNAAWDQHADYVAQVRPHWAALEQKLGLASGAYNCSTWRGTGQPQCCFAEPQAENDEKAARLTPNGRAVRQRGGS